MKTKCILLLLLFAVLFTQCKKNIENLNSPTGATPNSQTVISAGVLRNWFATNPAAKVLTVDWSKAQQASVNGVNIVRVPTLNINRMPQQGMSDKPQVADTKSSTAADLVTSNYYAAHPPELFFVQDNKSANPDSLHTYLLNFVPTNITSEFGQNNLWTGKLYDWDLNTNVLHVQELAQTKISKRYAQAFEKINSSSTKGITINSIWDWFGGILGDIGDFLNYIGYSLGIPGTSRVVADLGSPTGYYIYTWDWGFGGGGSGDSSYPSTDVYNSYVSGYDNSGNYTWISWMPYTIDPASGAVTSASDIILLLNITDLSKQTFLINNLTIADGLKNYLQQQGYTQDSESLVSWAIDYLSTNPNVSFDVFSNQFLGSSEGQDGDYDSAYWDNPNLSFPHQNLPTLAAFTQAFPSKQDPLYNTPQKMFNSIGGEIATFYVDEHSNTCAIRMSKALNYSGVVIPNISGQTFKGADNKYYFKAAYQVNIWMRKTFGTNTDNPPNTNHYHYTGIQAGAHGINLPALLSGKTGIYSIYSSDFRWASGHADFLQSNATCVNGCHFGDAPILYLDVWVLN